MNIIGYPMTKIDVWVLNKIKETEYLINMFLMIANLF